MDLAIDILGWCGAFIVLLASLNIAGANTAYKGAYPSTFVNAIWIGIAIFALCREKGEAAEAPGLLKTWYFGGLRVILFLFRVCAVPIRLRIAQHQDLGVGLAIVPPRLV